jgi:hypothetical protein
MKLLLHPIKLNNLIFTKFYGQYLGSFFIHTINFSYIDYYFEFGGIALFEHSFVHSTEIYQALAVCQAFC